MYYPAMLALEASDATVVITSISLVFGMLVALCLVIMLEGRIFDSIRAKKNPPAPKPAAPAKAAPAPKAAPAAPAAPGGIPGEVIAAISAAVYALEGTDAKITGIRRTKKPQAGSRRGVWGDAGVVSNTTPFM